MSTDGTLIVTGDRGVLRFERPLNHPPERVWRALVEPGELAAWFPVELHGERAEGAVLDLVFATPDDADDARAGAAGAPSMPGRLRIYEPPRLLEYTWGEDTLRFALSATDAGTLLVFTHAFAATDDRTQAAKTGAGWQQCLEGLDALLDGEPLDMSLDRWEAIHADYAGWITASP